MTHLLQHDVEVMHVKKNVCGILLGTSLHIKRRAKDTLKARRALTQTKIGKDLHPISKNDIV